MGPGFARRAFVCVSALGLLGASPPASAQDCPGDLVGFWPFDDGTATDAVGTHDGAVSGASATADGFLGGAYVFAGDDEITLPGAPFVSQALTVEAWVKGSSWTCQFGFCTVFASGDSDATPSGHYTVVHSDGRVRFVIAGDGGETNLYSTTALPLGEWAHLAVTVDGQTMRVFIDGVESASQPQPYPIRFEDHPFEIGGGLSRYFRGTIDEVAIHDRALGAAEIAQHYLNGLGGLDYCAPPDFDFDGVPDDGTDACPGTPLGEAGLVDADGCGPSQRDSDDDGLPDAFDACLDSPASDLDFIGQSIDLLGCGPADVCGGAGSADPDGDGFDYATDLCPWTDRAPGPAQPVVDGCSCGQILQLKPGNTEGERARGCTAQTLREFRDRGGWARTLPRPPG